MSQLQLTRSAAVAVGLAVLAALSHPMTMGDAGSGPANGAPRQRKLLIDRKDAAAYASLRAQDAIRLEVDYKSFKLLLIDEDALRGPAPLGSWPFRDDLDRIALNGYLLDTTDPEPTYRALPAELRHAAPKADLHLVQFIGPVQAAWIEALEATGAEPISYMAENAFVVRADGAAMGRLLALRETSPFVQFVGEYAPAFKLRPTLRARHAAGTGGSLDIVVQVADGPSAAESIATLQAMAQRAGRVYRVLDYHNVQLTIDGARLVEIALMDDVFAVEERWPRVRTDEAQCQILANNVTGSMVSGPGYLAWLAGKGFDDTQFGTFAVNLVDDAYSLTGHPDLPAGRVAFENNPTGQTGLQGFHGFFDAHIVAGFNSGTGASLEDARGLNYGLGVAPFARVGATAIFGPGDSTPTEWETAAYASGARISNNSFVFGSGGGSYDVNAQEYDRIVRDAQSGTAGLQQLSEIVGAGNFGGAGQNTIGSPATAKNVIAVGAGENDRQDGTACGRVDSEADNINDVIGFSSRGPVNLVGGDGRVKPDLMAPGTNITAGVPQPDFNGSGACKYFPTGQTLYRMSSGTSHAAPAVAGAAALVFQDFLNKGMPAPSPAMIKAYLMNSAQHMTGVGANDTLPSNNQGMGRVNLGRAFDGAARLLIDQSVIFGNSGETHLLSRQVADSGQPLRVTLVWTDAPGATTGAPWVNNLDLEVEHDGTTYRGNVFSLDSSVPGGLADVANNVESVFLPAGSSGAFTVSVRATNIVGNGVPGNADATDQDFALVVYNATATQVSPGEASAASETMLVTAFDPATGDITISYQPSCAATDHAVYFGDLASVSGLTYSGSVCGLGTSGSASFNPGPGSVFWVIVGQNATHEGSYGLDSAGQERPEDTTLPGCNLPQSLANRCD